MKTTIVIGVLLLTTASAVAQVDASTINRAAGAVERLRATMKDPVSFVLEGVFLKKPDKQGRSEVCYCYRSHNSYGGYTTGLSILMKKGYIMTVDPELAGTFLSPCRPGTRLADITAAVVGSLDPSKMQFSQIATPADRPKLLAALSKRLQKEGVAGYAEIVGDTLTLHSERAGFLRFHALVANKELVGAFERAGILTFVYRNDAEQNFAYDVKTERIITPVESAQATAVVPQSAAVTVEAVEPVAQSESLGEVARRAKSRQACLELAKANPSVSCK